VAHFACAVWLLPFISALSPFRGRTIAIQLDTETWKYTCSPSLDTDWRRKEDVVNREEVNWLLQTIKDPQNAKRFLLAQYELGRISLQLMNEVAPERDCINRSTTPLLTTATERSTEHSLMALLLATAW
jgi:hypothetical protein